MASQKLEDIFNTERTIPQTQKKLLNVKKGIEK